MQIKVDSDWRKLYELLADLIRQENKECLVSSLSEQIDDLIPADRGAAFIDYRNNKPYCTRSPEYATSKVPYFNTHYNVICPISFRMKDMMLGPVSWQRFQNSEYDTDFNRPLDIGFSIGCGFATIKSGSVHIVVLHRGRKTQPFSQVDEANLRSLIPLFGQLYSRHENQVAKEEYIIRQLCQKEGIIPLSDREVDVCVLLCRRLTAKAIADLLKISPRTVERHCQHIYYKMNVANRKELVNLIGTAKT